MEEEFELDLAGLDALMATVGTAAVFPSEPVFPPLYDDEGYSHGPDPDPVMASPKEEKPTRRRRAPNRTVREQIADGTLHPSGEAQDVLNELLTPLPPLMPPFRAPPALQVGPPALSVGGLDTLVEVIRDLGFEIRALREEMANRSELVGV